MSSASCLNCGQPVTGKFCAHCGQAAHTHRLSLRHFVLHDMIHGIWHVDKGLLFTVKEILLRPGHAARRYIEGKRVGQFNIVTLLLLLISLFLLLGNTQKLVELETQQEQNTFLHLILGHLKWTLLSVIPVTAFAGYLVFRRKKKRYNYTEHLLLTAYTAAGVLLVWIAMLLLKRVLRLDWSRLGGLPKWAGLAFFVFAYWQMFRQEYKLGGWLWRLLATLLLTTAFMLLLLIIVGMISAMIDGVFFEE